MDKSIDRSISSFRSGREREIKTGVVCKVVLNATLGMFSMGYAMGAINTVQDYLTGAVFGWDLDTETVIIGWMNGLYALGAGAGAFCGGELAKKLGRRKSMLVTDILTIVSVFLTLLPNADLMLIGRAASGISLGLNSAIVPLFVKEVSPHELEGLTGSVSQLQVACGGLFVFALGFGLPTETEIANGARSSLWGFILAFPILLSIFRFIIIWWVYPFESPAYFLMNNLPVEAKKVLEEFYSQRDARHELRRLREEQKEGKQEKVGYSTLFKAKYRTSLFVGCFIAFLQQMTGFNALTFYSSQIFEEIDVNGNYVLLTLLVGVFNVLSTAVSGQLIRRKGRRDILIGGLIATIISLCCISLFSWLGLAILADISTFLLTITFGLTYGPIIWIFIPEILPDIGVGIAVLCNWVALFLVGEYFQVLYESVGISRAFLCFAIFCIASLGIVTWKVQEPIFIDVDDSDDTEQKKSDPDETVPLKNHKDPISSI